ncbi:MAG: hypothetical protein UZ21_OP11001001087 [Microgenomates bacterium OLB22]|nr:MAG: hypothetical protein UZ21_OP11001001087 [Microgenomates bacterium OLB22]
MKNDTFLLTIIIAIYNEEESIPLLFKELLPRIEKYNYELIFVNDGSRDRSEELILEAAKTNKRIKYVAFTRNFSQQMAFTAGYEFARGDAIITMDADLQDPPELIDEMIAKWKEGYKIVYAQRKKRDEGFFKRETARFFYGMINSLSEVPIPQNVGDFRLLDREVVQFLNNLPESSRFLRGLVAWGGYSEAYVYFTRKERVAGETHYPLSKMINLALAGITSFSTRPLKLATYMGFFCSVLGFLGSFYAIIIRLFLPPEHWVTGWAALFTAIMFFGGVQLITIGIIGEYIGKIYHQVQARPFFLVRRTQNISLEK